MKNYLIMVEGAHDVAAVERCLKLCGIDRVYRKKADVPELWQRLIPSRYPFDGENLDRIAQQPTFVGNDEISIAIKAAQSDVQLFPELQRICHELKIDEKAQISGILLVCDADEKSAVQKQEMLLNRVHENDAFCVEKRADKILLRLEKIGDERLTIPIEIYSFPDNCNPGSLEDLLITSAKIQFPELLEPSATYVEGIDAEIYSELKNPTRKKKAIVGCVCNVLKPGKANQIAISDTAWINADTIQCEGFLQLHRMLRRFLDM